MDKKIIILFSIVVAFALLIFYNLYSINMVSQTVVETNLPKIKKIIQSQPSSEVVSAVSQPAGSFVAPLDRVAERITKKKFGQFITPQNSPVQPEKFRGYHTGTDFETFPEELNKDVEVKAVCSGKLVSKRSASGYGGVAVQSCESNSQPMTVVYGHLALESIAFKAGDDIEAGKVLGTLGANKSTQTDGERKHLHLSIHKGSSINIKGYVQSQAELSGWIDPCAYVCD